MGKTRDLFKKIGDIKGISHARMVMMKDRDSKDLKEAEETNRQQEYAITICSDFGAQKNKV